jgi:short-subunit dehydrogenase
MPTQVRSLVVGGTSGIGREIARALAARGEELVITGRELARAQTAAAELGDRHRGLALDLSQPQEVASRLAEVAGPIDHLVLSAVERDQNAVRNYDIGRATRAITLKVVGYTAVVHALAPRLASGASIVILGGIARDWPYPGSTTISMANGAVSSMVNAGCRTGAGQGQCRSSRRRRRQSGGTRDATGHDREHPGAHTDRPAGDHGGRSRRHAGAPR